MKKAIILIAILSLVTVFACSAQEVVYYEDTANITFLSEMFDLDGIQVDPDQEIEHEIYLFDDSVGLIMDQSIEDLLFIGVTTTLGLIIEPEYAYWSIGIRARVTNKYGEIAYSDFAYSLVPGDTATGRAFVIAEVSLRLERPSKPTMIMVAPN